MEYTLAEVHLFIRAIDQQRKMESRHNLTIMRISQATKEGYEKACRQIFGVED